MQLLILTNNPDRASFRQRIGIYLGTLRDQGVDCKVLQLPSGTWRRRKAFYAAQAFDGILLHRKMLNPWDAFWLRRQRKRVVYDFDDAIMYSDRRPEVISHGRFRRFGRSVALSCMAIAGNPYLANHAKRYSPNVRVLPTAVDVGSYRVSERGTDDRHVRLVWIGSDSTLKYLREIAPALEELGRHLRNVTLRIVCNAFFDLRNLRVEKRVWSKQTQAADLAGSDIGLAPLPDDPFTRGKCGFKILQYQAAGLPVVASPVGVNASYVRDGATGYAAHNHTEWVDRLGRLVQNRDLRTRMGQAGLSEVARFDVGIIGNRFCELLAEALQWT